MRKRFGIKHINSSSAGTVGNGIYNWVLSGSQQYLIALFDNTLKQMSVSGNTWNGTWLTISANSAGTQFSNAIMHFVTYQGTLIMTTENRDKVQRMAPTDTTYKNIETGGTGISPLAKYPQVWKEHVWLLNIGGGGQLTENCITLGSWTTLDVTTGASTTASFGGLSTFRLHAGAGVGSDAHLKITSNISNMTTSYSAEIKTYFTSVGTIASGDYAEMNIRNGSIAFRTRWSADGLQVFSGGTVWPTIGVGLVTTGTWNTWKFLVTAGTATAAMVDVYKENSVAGLQFLVANATTASNGQIDLTGFAGGTAARTDWYIDYLYINPITVRSNYYTDGVFNSWVTSSQASYTDNVLPTIPYLHYKCNDNTSNAIVTDSGSLGSNGLFLTSNTTINTSLISISGKISRAFSFSSSSIHNVSMSTGFINVVKTDTVGSISLWFYSTDTSGGALFAFSANSLDSRAVISLGTGNQITYSMRNGGSDVISLYSNTSVSLNVWNHCAVVQNGTAGPNIYINGSISSTTFLITTNKAAWMSSLDTLDSINLGLLRYGNFLAGPYQGYIDDFRYYRTSLSSSDIQAIYGDGNGTEGHPVTVREGTTIYLETFSYRVNNDGQYAVVSQTLSSSTAISGQSMALGMWFFGTNASTYKLRINDGTMDIDSSVLTANGTWQYQSLLFTPSASATSIRAQAISLSSSTFYIDQVAVVSNNISSSSQDLSDRLQRSVSGTYDTWTGGDSGINDITTPGDVGLTGSFILQDRMYVTKAWNIYRITYTGSVPLLDIKQARSVVGTKSPRATKNIDLEGIGEVVIFLGTDRNLYLFDGFASTNLSDNIQLSNTMAQVYTNNINSQALDKVFAVNHSNIGCYEIFLPIGTSPTPNFSIFYNYKTKAFWPFDNRNFLSGNVSDNGAGERVVVVIGANDGIAYEINTDENTDDDGSPINTYWTSFKLGEDYVLAKQDELRLATDSVTATPSFSWRTNYETTYTTKILRANTNSHVFDPATEANLIQFKISDNSTGQIWKVWHVKALERGLGIGS